MTLETVFQIIGYAIASFEFVLLFIQWKDRNRIKAKEEIWNANIQSIVNTVAKMQEKIDKGEIQTVKELREGINAIGNFANGIHVTIKKELQIKE